MTTCPQPVLDIIDDNEEDGLEVWDVNTEGKEFVCGGDLGLRNSRVGSKNPRRGHRGVSFIIRGGRLVHR